jgi:hypothetical protein
MSDRSSLNPKTMNDSSFGRSLKVTGRKAKPAQVSQYRNISQPKVNTIIQAHGFPRKLIHRQHKPSRQRHRKDRVTVEPAPKRQKHHPNTIRNPFYTHPTNDGHDPSEGEIERTVSKPKLRSSVSISPHPHIIKLANQSDSSTSSALAICRLFEDMFMIEV